MNKQPPAAGKTVVEYASPITPATRWSRSAIAAFVAALLAVVGFAIFFHAPNPLPLLALVSVPLAVVGLLRTSHRHVHGRTFAVIGLILGFVVIVASIALPSTGRARETAQRVKCSNNIRQIGLAIQMYADDYGGRYPTSLDLLFELDLLPSVFVCPSTEHRPAPGRTAAEQAASFYRGDHLTYVYLGSHLHADQVTDETILLYEPLGNHNEDGMNVLHGNLFVDWLNAADARQAIQRLQAGQNPPVVEPATPP
jgi:hypothetical protein